MLNIAPGQRQNQQFCEADDSIKELFIEIGCITTPLRAPNVHGYHEKKWRENGALKQELMHRMVYRRFFGDDIDGKVVRHTCDNKWCINPYHLKVGTQADNVQDRVDRNRSARGSDNGRAKLSEAEAWYVKTDQSHNISELARMFGVSRRSIKLIRDGINWKHIKTNIRMGPEAHKIYSPRQEPKIRYDEKRNCFYMRFQNSEPDGTIMSRYVSQEDGKKFATKEMAEAFKNKIWPQN